MHHHDNLLQLFIGWMLLGCSIGLNFVSSFIPKHFFIPLAIDYATIDFALSQLTHIVQIIGIAAGIYFTSRRNK